MDWQDTISNLLIVTGILYGSAVLAGSLSLGVICVLLLLVAIGLFVKHLIRRKA